MTDKQIQPEGGSPGLVVIGGDSSFQGCGFKSQHCILDGHFSHLFAAKNVMLFERTEINEKEAGNGHLKHRHNLSSVAVASI